MNFRIDDPKPTCAAEGCERLATSHRDGALCQAHYMRLRRHGDITVNKRALDGTTKPCDIEGCVRPATSRKAAYCGTHEMRVRRHGDVSVTKRNTKPLAERWRGEIRINANGCWIWPHLSKEGYGFASDNGPVWMHRWVWASQYGPIPRGMELDDLCKTPACCNPAHLEVVTPAENKRRQYRPNSAKTHCPRGHEYNEENTYVRVKKDGKRQRHCRACGRAAVARYNARVNEGGGD